MALDLDEHNYAKNKQTAGYQETSSDEESDDSDHAFSIGEPSTSASNGLLHGVSHLRGARMGVQKSSCVDRQKEHGASTHNNGWIAPDLSVGLVDDGDIPVTYIESASIFH